MIGWILDGIGVLGFVLSCIALIWDRRKYIEEQRERVNVDLSVYCGMELDGITHDQLRFQPASVRDQYWVTALQLRVVNTGRCPIYIKDVVLCSGDESDDIGSSRMETHFKASPTCSGPLQPSELRRFILPIHPGVTYEPEKSKWICIRSSKGEIYRDDSSNVAHYVQHCAERPQV